MYLIIYNVLTMC